MEHILLMSITVQTLNKLVAGVSGFQCHTWKTGVRENKVTGTMKESRTASVNTSETPGILPVSVSE